LNESDTYRERPPPLPWRSMVNCQWEQRVDAISDHRVIPDGCADVIVNPAGGAVAVGLADQAVVQRLSAGSSAVGLRLRPEAVATAFRTPADELRNRELPLDDVVGSRRARRLIDAVLEGAQDPLLLGTPPVEVALAIGLLADRSVDQTAQDLGLSSRHLRRLLIQHTGLGPKDHQRVMRLRRFVDSTAPLSVAATLSGYADQPHLSREVTRLCGVSPLRLRAERGPTPRAASLVDTP
jgi:AraC-like DNA-binding protein